MVHVLQSPAFVDHFSGNVSDMNVQATGIAALTPSLPPPNPANWQRDCQHDRNDYSGHTDAAQEPDGFASIAMKLSEYRKIEPGALEEMLFYDHPSGATRVRMSMQWKHDHVPGAQMVVPPPMPQEGLKPQ